MAEYLMRWRALRAHVKEHLLEVSQQVAAGEVDLTAGQVVARVWQAVDRLMDQLERCPEDLDLTSEAIEEQYGRPGRLPR